MAAANKVSRALGVAFLFQFVTSFTSGVFLRGAWSVDGNMQATFLKMASSPGVVQLNILVDMLTALGIVFLGAMLFLTLRKQNEKIALIAMGFYIIEAALLAVSRGDLFSLLGISQAYATSGQPASLLQLGSLVFASMDFVGSTLHMLAFCCGGILFYSLLARSTVVPRWLSLWGLITVLPLMVSMILLVFDVRLPFIIALPYVPFEFVIGLWILIKGIRVDEEDFEIGRVYSKPATGATRPLS